ncbi:DUF2059 domain-containing protein [Profundibacterium mesophilum]|uniref:DUF2059 domain-containing protein n=1 Tax=Profundibacterium mesophilum KAUST100406-0324 TaxID=1037889 RepID=A0A921NUS6_9RHOB|nr:DUF2059 domain-containing protein [Profundibacterium mesophilum]KAF0675174.1 uncharacterized protein PMES_02437 [Profundibacterium mesophilum KAUST100406-0324]
MRLRFALIAVAAGLLPLSSMQGAVAAQEAGQQDPAAAPMASETQSATPKDDSASIDALFDALGLGQVIETMRAEGLDYGADLKADLLAGQNAAGWEETVSQIHDAAVLDRLVRSELAERLAGVDTAPLVAFFESPLGQRIVALEIEARVAMAMEGAEEAARTRYAQMLKDGGPRTDALAELIEIGDLVEWNVMGAMNSNYAFYTGLLDGQGDMASPDINEEQILTDVWGQEEEIRTDTAEWIGAYLALAYEPLSDEQIAQYAEFSRGAPAQALNRALFGAFDVMYAQISRALGFAAATYMRGEDI